MVLVGRGDGGAVHARKVLDSGSAGSSLAIAGRGGGPGAMGWLGVVQGDTGKVQDMVVQWIAAGWEQVGMGVACPWHCMLRLGFRAWGCWVCPERGGGIG